MSLQNKDDFETLLHQNNLKKTKARMLILEILKDSQPKTADEIYSTLNKANDKLNLSTVYRTCETLAKKDILLKSNFTDDGIARYEYCQSGHVHHAICLGCNKIIPINDCPFGKFDQVMKSKYGFDVKSHRIEIYGYCHDCCKKNKKK